MYDMTMFAKAKQVRIVIAGVVLLAVSLLLSMLYLVSCTDTLDGEVFENQKPIVRFANIPPEGHRTGRNQVVYWYGTDEDGLIDYYRYHVATVAEVGSANAEDYILEVHDTEWVYIDVEPDKSEPRTERVIELTADSSDPVNRYIDQWVFLQAFDMEGLGSDVVFRLFSRNDNAPQTGINDFSQDLPFVDGQPGGIVTGVKLNWRGSDPIDYPGEDAPLEFQWRLYGPYDSSEFRQLVDSFVRPVYVARDGKVYNVGDLVEFCDTTLVIWCTTFVVTPETPTSRFGQLQIKLFVDDTNFINEPTLNKVVDSSFDGIDSWVSNTSDTIYNVYRHHATDTTVEMWFMFWIHCRDDASVADLTPAFDSFTVIKPMYERPVAVIDFTNYGGINATRPKMEPPLSYWKQVIEKWNPSVVFETSGAGGDEPGFAPDYLNVYKASEIPLVMLLKHKVLILYDDNVIFSKFNSARFLSRIFKAVDAGVNVWLTMRAPLEPGSGTYWEPKWIITPPTRYLTYFGVTRMVYSGWLCHAVALVDDQSPCAPRRIEDFVGAYALDSVGWPNLDIDTALLHSSYFWEHPLVGGWPARGLPGVDWSIRLSATKALYLYKSFYGADHPLGGKYKMEGNPVALRLSTTLYRTAHFNFTPLAIDSNQMQIVIDSLLNWLYDPTLSAPTSATRYPDAPVKISISEARARYWKRNEEDAEQRETAGLR